MTAIAHELWKTPGMPSWTSSLQHVAGQRPGQRFTFDEHRRAVLGHPLDEVQRSVRGRLPLRESLADPDAAAALSKALHDLLLMERGEEDLREDVRLLEAHRPSHGCPGLTALWCTVRGLLQAFLVMARPRSSARVTVEG